MKEKNVQGYDYPRYSLKGIAGTPVDVPLGGRAGQAPVNATFTLMRNDGDPRMDGAFNERFVTRLVPADHVRCRSVIPASEGLGHDLVAWQHHSECYAKLTAAYSYLHRPSRSRFPTRGQPLRPASCHRE